MSYRRIPIYDFQFVSCKWYDSHMPAHHWTFLTNHAHVFLCISRDPDIRLRDVAEMVGITERAAQRIVADLEAEGYITTERIGRRNRYVVHPEAPLRHPIEQQRAVGNLMRLLDIRPEVASGTAG